MLTGVSAQATITNWVPTAPLMDNTGTLTAAGQTQADSIATALVGVNLLAVYGCPDCADGGASYVDVTRQGVLSSHAYEFYNPPPELVDADAFITDVFGGLRSCAATTYVTPDASCVPY